MSKNLANGQLANTSTAMFTATGPDVLNILCGNTSGSNTETVVITITRTASGTARRIYRGSLAPNEQLVITGLPIESGDILKGQATDAATVDYDVTGQGVQAGNMPGGPLSVETLDANGALKQVNSGFSGNVTFSGSVTSTSPSGGVGYATGAGGTVTQATNKSTGVTLNKIVGQVTMNNATLNNATNVLFTLTNSAIAATDAVIVEHSSAGTSGAYQVWASNIGAGSCDINVRNVSGGNLGEAIVLTFSVIKGANS